MSAIVTCASSAKALIVTRSLGRKGISVTTGDKSKFAPAFFSKYSKNHFIYPSPQTSEHEFVKTLLEYVKKNKHDVLIPTHSEETYIISKYMEKLKPFIKVPLMDYNTIMKVNDKGELMKIATELGIPIPKTFHLRNITEIKEIANQAQYPAVIKLTDRTSSVGQSYVNSSEQLIATYKETVSRFNIQSSNLPIVQEYIPGDGYGVSVLYNQGDLRALFTHKRLREFPATGGPSTLRISVRNSEMEKIAIKLMDFLNWHGVAMVEFKLHAKTKKPYLLEVNPRFWGSIYQAVSSGVDFPYLLYKMALDGDVESVLDYRVGVKTRFFLLDLKAFPGYFKNNKNKLKIIKEFVKVKNINFDIESIEDFEGTFFSYIYSIKQFHRR